MLLSLWSKGTADAEEWCSPMLGVIGRREMERATGTASIHSELSMGDDKTAPSASKGMPRGIPYIVTSEGAEQFSCLMMDSSGNPDLLGEEEARQWYHTFTSAESLGDIHQLLLVR